MFISGKKAKVCAAEDCLDTTECKDVFYRNDSCCAQCKYFTT